MKPRYIFGFLQENLNGIVHSGENENWTVAFLSKVVLIVSCKPVPLFKTHGADFYRFKFGFDCSNKKPVTLLILKALNFVKL